MTTDADPRVARSQSRIVAAATECFLERGYAGTTIDAIAARAGVVRRTVFNVFADKESVLRACALASIATAETFITALVERTPAIADPAVELSDLARGLARTVLSGPVIALRRLLAAESEHFPELVEEYWRRAPAAMITALAVLFARCAAAGTLRVADPDLAATQFAYLVLGEALDRGMLGLPRTALADALRSAESGAHVFLRAHAP